MADVEKNPPKAGIFVDSENVSRYRINYQVLLQYCSDLGKVKIANAYVKDTPERRPLILALGHIGFRVIRIVPISYQNFLSNIDYSMLTVRELHRRISQ